MHMDKNNNRINKKMIKNHKIEVLLKTDFDIGSIVTGTRKHFLNSFVTDERLRRRKKIWPEVELNKKIKNLYR